MDNSLKDRVLESVDIVDVVGERVHLTRKGKDYVGLCPFHADHKPSLSVSPGKRIFKCWACGVGGDVIRFVQLYERIEFREALAILARRAGIELHSSPADRRAWQSREEIRAAIAWARQHFQRNLEATAGGHRAREYALGRGLTTETIARYGLGYAADARDDLLSAGRRKGLRPEILQEAGLVITNDRGVTYDRFRNRLIFPIADTLGRPIAFGGRALGDDPAKYLNSPEGVVFSKSRVLYGLHFARDAIRRQDAAVIVEGYLDAVLLGQYGFQNVVATLGTALTEAHAKLLRPVAGTLYMCFDGDAAGVRAAQRAVEVALRTQTQVKVVLLESGQDPADCVLASGAAGFGSRLKQAVDALEFKWAQAVSAYGDGGQRGRRAAIEEFVQFVAQVAVAGGVDPIDQDVLIGRLSELLGVPADEVFDLLSRAKRSLRRQAGAPTAAAENASAYEAAIRGLSGGLVTAVESVLGLLLRDPKCWQWVDDTVANGASHSETWQRLHGVLLEVHREVGEYSVEGIVSRCDDSALCELVGRASARVAGVASTAEAFCAARERLASELNVLRMGRLCGALHKDQAEDGLEDADKFRSLREIARAQHSALSAERRWNAASEA